MIHFPRSCPPRGFSLIDALLAFAVLSIAALATLQTQASLRLNTDVARQRADAVRLAQDELEHWRDDFVDLGNTPEPVDLDSGAGSNAHYRLTRSVLTSDEPRLRSAVLRVDWLDRRGNAQSVLLPSALHELDPVVGAALSLVAADASSKRPLGRNAAIPPQARDLGDGRSAITLSSTLAWVIDNDSGIVTARCDLLAGESIASLTAEALRRRCSAVQGLLLSGFVNFADKAMPHELDIVVRSESGAPLRHECFDRAQAQAVYYVCALMPADALRWSGSSTILPLGWTIGDAAPSARVCRYSADDDKNGRIDNIEHPLVYRDVRVALDHQNFIVVAAAARCPDGTVEHQPQGAPSPGSQ